MTNPADRPGPEAPARGLEQLKREGRGQHPVVVRNVDDALRLGEIFVRSGFFKDSKAVSQAVVKILYGVELGIGPMAAMTGITMVDGSLSLGANLVASRINASPDHRYRILEHTREVCTIEFSAREEGEWIVRGTTTWDTEDVKLAGLAGKDNHRKYPRAMLFARAMTEGARMYVSELFGGTPVYTGEELGLELAEAEAEATEAAAAGAQAIAEQEARVAAQAGPVEEQTDEGEEGELEDPGDGEGEPATPVEPAPTDGGGAAQTPQEATEPQEAQDPAEAPDGREAPAEAAQAPESGDGLPAFPTTEEAAAAREAAAAPLEAPGPGNGDPEDTAHDDAPIPPASSRQPTPAQGASLLAQTRLAGLLSLGVPGPRVRELREAFEATDDLALADDDTYHALADAVRAEATAGGEE